MKTKLKCKECKKSFEVLWKQRHRKYCSRRCYGLARKKWKWSDEVKKKIGEGHLGLRHTQETKDKISQTKKEKYEKGETVAWNKGLTKKQDFRIEEQAVRQSETKKRNQGYAKENNPNWKGGKKYWKKFSYNKGWIAKSKAFKLLYPLCGCGKIAEVVHHGDFDSKNDVTENLVSLCRKCHKGIHNKRRQNVRGAN